MRSALIKPTAPVIKPLYGKLTNATIKHGNDQARDIKNLLLKNKKSLPPKRYSSHTNKILKPNLEIKPHKNLFASSSCSI